MEHLSKQQIILLALLVSFVTALATGVVTVSLMDQAPTSVGQTISRVIERTIEGTSSQSAFAGNIQAYEDKIANAVEKVASSTVQIKSKDDGSILGTGLIVSKGGVIVTDKSVIAQANEYIAVLHNGKQFPIAIVQSQINGDIVFLAPVYPNISSSKSLLPITFSTIPKLGQTILSLSGTSTAVLEQAIVTAINSDPNNSSASIIHTSISKSKIIAGNSLFNTSGEVIGINLSSYQNNETANFYSMNALKYVIPVIGR
jgi:S1-C subfamily serine protease